MEKQNYKKYDVLVYFHNLFNSFQITIEIGFHRGGCIICMDYSQYAAESYVRLVRLFEPIVQILTLELFLLDHVGFIMNNGYIFGFSYGGQLATEAGRRIGNQRLKEIDSIYKNQIYRKKTKFF